MAATIFALSSGRGAAGVAVIRVSGPAAHQAAEALAGPLPPPRQASLRRLRAADGTVLDHALLLVFAAPASATGEDMAEFHVHGGPAVVSAVMAALAALPGLVPAQAGDFTRRAFDNGKMDLAQVEGLADLIAAETEAQRRQALRQMDGALSHLVEGWRTQLVQAMARIEADIDFAEGEDDVPDGIAAQAGGIIVSLRNAIAAHLGDGHRGERLREGFAVAITGAPNVGKSSLLNALARRDVAIVSPIAGTTRDAIEVHLNLHGLPVTLIDTAGLRDTDDPIEAEGVRRARDKAARADLRLLLLEKGPALTQADTLVIINKIDASGHEPGWHDGALYLSAATGAGLAELIAELARRAGDAMAVGEAPALTRLRHREALQRCVSHLDEALALDDDLVLAAESLRLAARALGRISGRIDVEAVLGEIFSSFCIGK